MNIIVTGASRGIGKKIAQHLTNKSHNIIGMGRSLEEKGNNYSIDITDENHVNYVVKKIAAKFGQIDLLINNAGIFKSAPFVDCKPSDIIDIVTTNLIGTMVVTHAVLPFLTRPNGYIINIASVAALNGIKNQAIYSASKAGLRGFAQALGQELAPDIRISTIFPGGVNTELWNEENPYPGNQNHLLKPYDIVRTVEYLMILPKYITMKEITVFPESEFH